MQGDFINIITDIRGTPANNYEDGLYREIVAMYNDMYAVVGYMKTDEVGILTDLPLYSDKEHGFSVLITDTTPQSVYVKMSDDICPVGATTASCWYPPIPVGQDAVSARESAVAAELAKDLAELAAQDAHSSALSAATAETNAEISANEARVIADNLAILDKAVGILEYTVTVANQRDFLVWTEAETLTISMNGFILQYKKNDGTIDDYEILGSTVRLTIGASIGDVIRVIGYDFESDCLTCPGADNNYPAVDEYPATDLYPMG